MSRRGSFSQKKCVAFRRCCFLPKRREGESEEREEGKKFARKKQKKGGKIKKRKKDLSLSLSVLSSIHHRYENSTHATPFFIIDASDFFERVIYIYIYI